MRALVLALGLTAIGTPALAQVCQDDLPIPGTVPLTTMFGAFDLTGAVVGATRLIEDQLLPSLRSEPGFAFAYDSANVLGAQSIAFCQSRRLSVDLGTGNMGLAYRTGPVSFFYSGAAVSSAFFEANALLRWSAGLGLPAAGAVISPMAAAQRRVDADEFGFGMDFVAGLGLHPSFLDVMVGYVGSTGLFVGMFQRDSRLTLGLVVTDEFQRLPYLFFGFKNLDWLFGRSAVEAIGSTSLRFERIELVTLSGGEVAREDIPDAAVKPLEYAFAKIEQNGLAGGLFNLHVAVLLRPKIDIYEATAAWNVTCGSPDDDDCDVPMKFSAGVVKVPEVTFFGRETGFVPRLEFSIGAGRSFHFAVGWNDPAMLRVFPFAINTIYTKIAITWPDPRG